MVQGKWTKAFNIPRAIDGATLNDCRLSIDTKNRKYPKDIIASPRIGIPNKGDWTHKSLRYTVKGNPFVSRMRKSDCMFPKILGNKCHLSLITIMKMKSISL